MEKFTGYDVGARNSIKGDPLLPERKKIVPRRVSIDGRWMKSTDLGLLFDSCAIRSRPRERG